MPAVRHGIVCGAEGWNVSLYRCESRPAAGERRSTDLRGVVARMPGADVEMAPFVWRPQGQPYGLSKWRLKLVAGYVAEHLGDKVTLADMAAAARLSRMHFAALFVRATGLRPHDYLLRQRVIAAGELLLETDKPIVQVALGVGFQTQAHFTTVFERVTGSTPARWRAERRSAEPLHR
jgi:transcriptional regulator GlxA family with amidase domain